MHEAMIKLHIKSFLVWLTHEQKLPDSFVKEIEDTLTELQSVVGELLAATETDHDKHENFTGILQRL